MEQPRRTCLGRDAELRVLSDRLTAARAGRGEPILVQGEQGIGKTALLRDLAALARGVTVLTHAGTPQETGLPWAGLEAVLRPHAAALGRLPAARRRALSVVLGHESGPGPDPLLAGQATAELLGAAGHVLCLVDDVHLLDEPSARALAIAARRLSPSPCAVVLAARPGAPATELFDGVPALRLPPLGLVDAGRLLDRLVETGLDPRARRRLLAEARGNPAALVDFVEGVDPAELAGGAGAPRGDDARQLPAGVRDALARSAGLPRETRLLLLLVAADATGNRALLRRAAARLGLSLTALATAQDAGLVDTRTQILFRHPLVRAEVYRQAADGDRRAVHRALARVTHPHRDPERHAWHTSLAGADADDVLSAVLRTHAERARASRGAAAAAVLLERAAEHTSRPQTESDLRRQAAHAWHEAGDLERARALLESAPKGGLSSGGDTATLLLAQMAFDQRHGRDEADELVASSTAALAPGRAVQVTLRALVGVTISGSPAARDQAAALAATVGAGVRPSSFAEHALVAFATALGRTPGSAPRAVEQARAALGVLAGLDDVSDGIDFMWIWLACTLAWDDVAALDLSRRYVEDVRRHGRMSQAPLALNYAAVAEMHAGRFAEAEHLSLRASAARHVTGARENRRVDLMLAAWQGDAPRVTELARRSEQLADASGETRVHATIAYSRMLLQNGLGRYAGALRALDRERDDIGFDPYLLPEEVEAAARTGDAGRARAALARLSPSALVAGTPWAVGTETRCRALVAGRDAHADTLYREALEAMAGSANLAQLARTRLLHGEWLRRARRHAEARSQLRTAYEELDAMGAAAFAARAARELRAQGETARSARHDGPALTAQQLEIARLAARGGTSKEIGRALVISPRTVDAHIRNVFTRLGVSSRRDIAPALQELGIDLVIRG